MLTVGCGDRAADVFHPIVTPHDEALEASGDPWTSAGGSDAPDECHGSGADAVRHASRGPVETILDEVRTACRNVRSAMRDLWR